MRARTFVVPAGGLAYRAPDPFPGVTCPVGASGDPVVPLDALSAPTGDDLLPAVILNAPRGRAWQTDELAPPIGTTVQHKTWAILADALSVFYGILTRAGLSAFPSVTDETGLQAWEADYGLPDLCLGDSPSQAQRRAQVRQALALPETNSRQDLVCLLAANGYAADVDEWEGFEFGQSGFGDEGFGHPDLPHCFFVTAPNLPLSWITFGETGFGEDGFGTFPPDGLICLVERQRQAHARAYYVMQGAVL